MIGLLTIFKMSAFTSDLTDDNMGEFEVDIISETDSIDFIETTDDTTNDPVNKTNTKNKLMKIYSNMINTIRLIYSIGFSGFNDFNESNELNDSNESDITINISDDMYNLIRRLLHSPDMLIPTSSTDPKFSINSPSETHELFWDMNWELQWVKENFDLLMHLLKTPSDIMNIGFDSRLKFIDLKEVDFDKMRNKHKLAPDVSRLSYTILNAKLKFSMFVHKLNTELRHLYDLILNSKDDISELNEFIELKSYRRTFYMMFYKLRFQLNRLIN